MKKNIKQLKFMKEEKKAFKIVQAFTEKKEINTVELRHSRKVSLGIKFADQTPPNNLDGENF